MIRVAAVADIHAGPETAGALAPLLTGLRDEADILFLAGDLTRAGKPDEAEILVAELAEAGVPIVAVLGNHDYHSDQASQITAILKDAGIHVLDRSS
ncbi:MAG: Calcineurin-like phosphoesterase superfamily domain protein, partial [Geminicoccaceae bacterium]|nr:Calcineurin-like phosphoesterase superfamily domain protein [Geminicoccaceae bacterium]